MAKQIRCISLSSELGAGTRGASLGFQSLKMASFAKDREYFTQFNNVEVPQYNERLFHTFEDPSAIRLESIAKTFEHSAKAIVDCVNDGDFPLVFSGDHSNAAGTMMGVAQAYPNKRLGVIWIDAHADLHSPFTSPSGNVHGMPLAMTIAEDNTESQINSPKESTIEIWNKLKGTSSRVNPSDLFFIGVRDTEAPEDHLMAKYNMPNVKTNDLRERGMKSIAQEAIQYLTDCDIIYISFDVDSMDPSVSIGTGTPVPNGLTKLEASVLMQELLESPKVCCLETTEINPLLCDKGNAMAEAALEVLKPVIDKIEKLHVQS